MREKVAALVLVLALGLPGCRAYDTRYWSFPLNSMQMVENAAHYKWTYGQALAAELGWHVFPWAWVESSVDVVLLPFTLLHDLFSVATRHPGDGFEEQVRAERHPREEGARTLTPSEAAGRLGREFPGTREPGGVAPKVR